MSNTLTAFPPITPLGRSASLPTDWQTRLKPFWHTMQCGVLTSADALPLHYYQFRVPGAHQAIVLSSGRVEMAIKYAELCYELVQAGYSVFLLDHRGQGLSGRELANPEKGYVSDFSLYQQDFAQFIDHIVQPTGHKYHIALGHSMGCAILAGYLQHYTHPFSGAIFASPMFGIYTGLVPASIAEAIALAFGVLNRRICQTPWYFPGQSNYQEKAFANNPLTSCEERYTWLHQLFRDEPQARLGGVTTHWVQAAIVAMRRLQIDVTTWQLPVLLLQAGADKVVSNHAQNLWFQQLPAELLRQKVTLQDARHEIFMENDQIRQQALQAINVFLAQLSATT
ncbi:alpha/beta fold hydrolase [Rheinheimera maricola]|uniref:Alpha/beta fold hydrolase n=1 Tax=Rheinheimera maricola TaxID=2793282 RepID=A0ABS7X8U3_9GAMM|nr:alpha/beta fold hydrolase [Rheinheimera maricola]MBZ9611232.1 alpha/beta fold hydrolase [Rheinheimera maricola]